MVVESLESIDVRSPSLSQGSQVTTQADLPSPESHRLLSVEGQVACCVWDSPPTKARDRDEDFPFQPQRRCIVVALSGTGQDRRHHWCQLLGGLESDNAAGTSDGDDLVHCSE